jgi:hypothetical protein
MSRTTIVPTAQTKANQATDFYLKSNGSNTVNGNFFINGDVIFNDIGDELVCKVQGSLGGESCILFNQVNGNIERWAIGTQGVEAGANSGNNFRIFAYDDTGVALSSPLQITRSNGQVTIPASCAVGTTLGVGLQGAAGTIQVIGPNGAAQVYDETYNRPSAGNDALLFTASVDGITGGASTPFACTRTGTYILSITLQAYANTFNWTPGTTSLLYVLTADGGGLTVAGAQLYVGCIANPNLMPPIGASFPGNFIEFQQDVLVQLTTGVTYTILCGSTGAPHLGLGGNVAIVVQELIA